MAMDRRRWLQRFASSDDEPGPPQEPLHIPPQRRPPGALDEATFLEPRLLATGMRYVLVNGDFAVENGAPTHGLSGRVLRRSPPISQ